MPSILISIFLFYIRSIKHYFLMDKGDFFVHFMDLTEDELKKPVDDIVPPRLEALLELALRMSTANTDPFKDDLKVGLNMVKPPFLWSLSSSGFDSFFLYFLLCLSSLFRST